MDVGNQQNRDTAKADRSRVGWTFGKLPKCPIVVASPLDCLSPHLPLTCKTNTSTVTKNSLWPVQGCYATADHSTIATSTTPLSPMDSTPVYGAAAVVAMVLDR